MSPKNGEENENLGYLSPVLSIQERNMSLGTDVNCSSDDNIQTMFNMFNIQVRHYENFQVFTPSVLHCGMNLAF